MEAVSLRIGGRVAECVMVERAATVQWEGKAERLKVSENPVRDASPRCRVGVGGKAGDVVTLAAELVPPQPARPEAPRLEDHVPAMVRAKAVACIFRH
jgi:hypothetical protein